MSSLSRVTVARSLDIIALVAFDKETTNVSSPSTSVSDNTEIVIVWVKGSPGLKVRVPLVPEQIALISGGIPVLITRGFMVMISLLEQLVKLMRSIRSALG